MKKLNQNNLFFLYLVLFALLYSLPMYTADKYYMKGQENYIGVYNEDIEGSVEIGNIDNSRGPGNYGSMYDAQLDEEELVVGIGEALEEDGPIRENLFIFLLSSIIYVIIIVGRGRLKT
ncbi:hypothetical protein LJB92_04375 [Bacteroidales bacterium OttesenSCG-928-M06]|nr:hypothetical protein [Bacteroidales bacterium OttesenSCG-928-M06]